MCLDIILHWNVQVQLKTDALYHSGKIAHIRYAISLSFYCHPYNRPQYEQYDSVNLVKWLLSVQCYAMHKQNINLPVYVSVCPSHFLSTRIQVRSLNRFLQLIA